MQALEKGVRWFTDESRMLAGLNVAFGRRDTAVSLCRNYREDTLFDLASLTKMFTVMTVMHLRDQGKLSLSDPLSRWDKRFQFLSQVTVGELCAFAHKLQTAGRIDDAEDAPLGRERLFAARSLPHESGRVYSDIHAMILKYVIEGVCGQPYEDYLQTWLFKPLGLTDITARVPREQLERCACFNREHRILGDAYLLREDIVPGTPHDPKARLLSPRGEDLCGHAGLFGSLKDLTRLCQALLGGDVLSPLTLKEMAVNRTGKPLDWGYSQYLGYQCFVKHPDQRHSEVPPYMSEHAVSWSGFTGHHLSLDVEKGLFCLLLGNRVQDRLTVIQDKTLAQLGLNSDGSGCILWPDGRQVYSSVDYVYQKDERIHTPIARLINDL